MADKKLNSVSPVTDAAYVYAETSNGETVKIAKADLASIVAGLMNGFRMDVESVSCDRIVPKSRFFRVAEVINAAGERPSDSVDGYILAFKWEALSYCTQIFVDPNKNDLWIRSDKGTGFGEWEKMAKV